LRVVFFEAHDLALRTCRADAVPLQATPGAIVLDGTEDGGVVIGVRASDNRGKEENHTDGDH